MRNYLKVFFLLCFTLNLYAQDVQIQGVVVSGTDDYPLPGVNVVVKGTTNGTMTDIDGQFTLNAPEGSTISITYIGFKPMEVKADPSKAMRIVMAEDTELLDEVVVVGYGVQKKSVVTAAISRVTADDLNTATPSRIEDALKGKVSGVQITQSSGQPGADSKVRIRGIGTVNNSDPLYIVDGMPVDGGISYLNPTDIESVEILKDAASAAIYGARAANGVVLVTTKQGKVGKPNINYDFSIGWQNPWKKKSVLNATEYMTLMNEMQSNDNEPLRFTEAQIKSAGAGTNWQDETFNKNAPVKNHQVSVNGGTDKVTYFFSFGYFDQEGIVGGNYDKSNYKRYSLRSNTTYDIYEVKDRSYLNKLRVGINMSYARITSTGVEVNSEFGSVLGSAVGFDPTLPVYATEPDALLALHPYAVKDKDGKVFSISDNLQELANPVAMLNQPNSNINNEDKFVATFWGELDIYEGLKFRTSYGADLAFWGRDEYSFPYYLSPQGKNNDQSSVYSEMNRGYTWQVENVLTYTKTFDSKHNLSVLLGQSAKKYTNRHLKGWDYNLFSTDPDRANINSGIADRERERVEGGVGPDKSNFHSMASYFARLDYNFDERYIIQATVRRDGSSNFGPQNKWAVFPSVSLGWNITNEAFMEGRPGWLNNLKIRGSWGKNGNERIGPFRYTSLMDGNQSYYFGSGTNASMIWGSSPSVISNPNVKWEESEQLDLGFETRLFNHSLTFGFDYFKKKTIGMLMDQPIPSYVGKGAPIANAGDMENWGLEFEASYRISINKVNLNFGANASYLRNKLIKLGNESGENIYADGGASGLGSYIKGQNGEVYPYFYGFKTDGILQNQAEVDAYNNKYGESAQIGDVRFVDTTGDDKITEDDKVKIGKGMPDWTFGFTLGAEWNNFDLNLFFQGTAGNDIFDFSQRSDLPLMNRPSWILDRWHGEGTSDRIPRMTSKDPNRNWRSSDLYVKNGNYLRLKTLQIGYTLPSSLVRKATIQRLRIFFTGENVFTFTKYDGFDPEIAAGDDYFNIGVDKGIYPQSRTFSVGANITF